LKLGGEEIGAMNIGPVTILCLEPEIFVENLNLAFKLKKNFHILKMYP
jgi:hypothetical protein